jgi:hypothetical protein
MLALAKPGVVAKLQAKKLFTPWTMKSFQGFVKYVIGC